MTIDFTKLQQVFIEKIRREENLILRGHEVAFEVNPNYEFENHRITVRVKVFGEEFSVSYPKSDTSIDELIMDFYSRLHDYSADSAKDLIIRLKILQLENRFAEQINALREIVLTRQKSLRPEEVLFDFSDIIPSEKDINGFPKFGLFISIKGEQILMKEIGINEFSHKLGEELESKVFEKLMD